MSVAQIFGNALFKLLTVIFSLWCIYISYDKTPLEEFEIVGNACAWSCFAAAASLLVMTPFYHLDKHFQKINDGSPAIKAASITVRIVSHSTLVFATASLLSLVAFMITLPAFFLAKSYVIIRSFL